MHSTYSPRTSLRQHLHIIAGVTHANVNPVNVACRWQPHTPDKWTVPQMKRQLTLFNLAPQFLISGTRGWWCVEGAWHFKQIVITSELKTMQRITKTNNNHLPKQRAPVDNWMTMILASMQIGPKISTVNRINIRLISICIYRTQSTAIILYYYFKYFTDRFKWNLN